MARTVVIAEDEAIVRLDLREILEEQGFDVVGETGRGDEAVELARQHRPDLVILDIKMPGLDGLSAASEINAERASAILIHPRLFDHRLQQRPLRVRNRTQVFRQRACHPQARAGVEARSSRLRYGRRNASGRKRPRRRHCFDAEGRHGRPCRARRQCRRRSPLHRLLTGRSRRLELSQDWN